MLRVYTNNTWESTNNTLTLPKIQVSRWTKVQFDLQETYMFNVVFEVTKSATYGDMALDDISIVNKPCKGN